MMQVELYTVIILIIEVGRLVFFRKAELRTILVELYMQVGQRSGFYRMGVR